MFSKKDPSGERRRGITTFFRPLQRHNPNTVNAEGRSTALTGERASACSSGIETIKGGCPLCGSDVRGNDKLKFYCKRCNMLFERSNLNTERAEENTLQPSESIPAGEGGTRHEDALEGEREREEREKEKKVQHEKIRAADESIGKREISKEDSSERTLIASMKSQLYHAANCPFAKNIIHKNRKIFKDRNEAEAAGYKPCVCCR